MQTWTLLHVQHIAYTNCQQLTTNKRQLTAKRRRVCANRQTTCLDSKKRGGGSLMAPNAVSGRKGWGPRRTDKLRT